MISWASDLDNSSYLLSVWFKQEVKILEMLKSERRSDSTDYVWDGW